LNILFFTQHDIWIQGREVVPILRAELQKVKKERDLLKCFLAKKMNVSPFAIAMIALAIVF
jgi:hypothetical protein